MITSEQEIITFIKTKAWKIAQRTQGSGLTHEDYFQEGYMAYLKAKDRYDEQSHKGVTLLGFLRQRIEGAMLDASRSFYWLGNAECRRRAKALRAGDTSQPAVLTSDFIPERYSYLEDEDLNMEDLMEFVSKGLSPRLKDMFYMRVSGVEFKKIAHKYEITMNAIQVQWHRNIVPHVASRLESYLQEVSIGKV